MELENTITGLKIKSKLDLVKERISELKKKKNQWHSSNHRNKKKKRKRVKSENSLRNFGTPSSGQIISFISQKEKQEKKGQGAYLNKWGLKTSLIWVKKQTFRPTKTRVSNKMNLKSPTLRNMIIKSFKVRDMERILEATKEKQFVTYIQVSTPPPAPDKTVSKFFSRSV